MAVCSVAPHLPSHYMFPFFMLCSERREIKYVSSWCFVVTIKAAAGAARNKSSQRINLRIVNTRVEYDGSESVVDGRDVDFSGVVVVGLLVVRSIDERVSGIFDIVVEMSNYQRSSFFSKGAQEGCFNCVW